MNLMPISVLISTDKLRLVSQVYMVSAHVDCPPCTGCMDHCLNLHAATCFLLLFVCWVCYIACSVKCVVYDLRRILDSRF
jgi:hypothetical protein